MKDVVKALVIALIIVVLGEVVLAWQYHRLEKKRFPALEEKLEKQEQEIQQKAARDVLEKFMLARLEKNEARADLYLAEQAMQQKLQGEFDLLGDFSDYEILQTDKIGESQFRFMVKLYGEGRVSYIIETIVLQKILDQYYIESVAIAG